MRRHIFFFLSIAILVFGLPLGSNAKLSIEFPFGLSNQNIQFPKGGLVSKVNYPNKLGKRQLSTDSVKLITLTSEVSEVDISLNWSIDSMIKNKFFIVEKKDQNDTFIEVGRSKGKESKDDKIKEYTFVDKTPRYGDNQYRLGYKNNNGETSYIDTISVNFESLPSELDYFFPNPVTEWPTKLKINSTSKNDLTVVVFDNFGTQLLEEVRQVEEGEQILEFYFHQLEDGYYIITIEQGLLSESRFLIVEKDI